MLSYEEAFHRIIASVHRLPSQRRAIQQCLGYVLAESVTARQPVPAFRHSSMDGYAISFDDLARNSQAGTPAPHQDRAPEFGTSFKIVDIIRAGHSSSLGLGRGEAAQIATGAMVPDGADTVVPIEDCTVAGNTVTINAEVRRGQCIRQAGDNVGTGAIVATACHIIGPGTIGMLAAVGRATVKVYRRPRVGIITTGDELVSPGTRLKPGQIYNSNRYSVAAQVTEAGGVVFKQLRATDDRESLRAAFDACADCDMILSTGGVSVGEFDLVKEIFSERGDVDFWRVAIRPGKPIAYGHWGERVFFGLPGNPVSSMVTFELFARPVIRKMIGHSVWQRTTVQARLLNQAEHEPGRRSFQRVRLDREDNEYVARVLGGQGSGMLHAMVEANGLLIVPEDEQAIDAGRLGTVMVIGLVT